MYSPQRTMEDWKAPRARCTAAAVVLLLLIETGGALAFRLPRLDQRPMHTDEAVHAAQVGILLDTGRYVYDPAEYHGPTPYYFALPFIWLSGAKTLAETNEAMLRIVPVVFGAGLILLLFFIGDALGWPAALVAGLFTALSPAMVFYSRYYIQEMLLVWFTFATIVFSWRYSRSWRLPWALLAGAGVGLMRATKETCVLALAAMAGGLVCTWLWDHWRDRSIDHAELRGKAREAAWHVVVAVALNVVVVVVILSGFFTNLRGPYDAVMTYFGYVHRAAGEGGAIHNHPWYYYLRLLLYTRYAAGPWWSESLIVILSVVGGAAALFCRRMRGGEIHFLRFLTFYTLGNVVIYSAIPYKTPWCMLTFLHGMILLAGVGVVTILRLLPNKPTKAVAALLLAAATVQLGAQACRANYVYCADNRNPYVYAHSTMDVMRLAQRMEDLAACQPEGYNMLVKVVAPDSDYWPMPWYLRRFTNVGYWTDVPDAPDAPVIIAGADIEPALDAKLRGSYEKEYYGLRPTVFLVVYIQSDLWEAFMKTRS